MVEKDIPQTLLLKDEEKRILESRKNTDLSPLSLFKVGVLCRTLVDFDELMNRELLKQHRKIMPVLRITNTISCEVMYVVKKVKTISLMLKVSGGQCA